MANQFNGKFKLESCSNCVEYYKSINVPQTEIDKYAYTDDPANIIELEILIENGNMTRKFFIGGKQVYEEKAKLGEAKTSKFEVIEFTTTTTIEGNKMVDATKRTGQKDSRYEYTTKGNKLILEMTSAAGIKGRKEYIKV